MSVSRDYRSVFSPPIRSSFLGDSAGNGPLQGITSRSHEAALDWLSVADRVGHFVDLDASAHAMGAMVRRRGVPAATNLLCLAFLYGPGRMPLRLIAERAEASGIARVSEPALLRRLCNARTWLAYLADNLIGLQLANLGAPSVAPPSPHSPAWAARPLPPLDGSPVPPLTHQVRLARGFILDFEPWPNETYVDAQIHWLLCVRWTFVSSTIKDGPVARAHPEPQLPVSTLEQTRQLAHLIAAVVSRDDQGSFARS